MCAKELLVGNIVNESWNITKNNTWIFAGTFLCYLLISFVISNLFEDDLDLTNLTTSPGIFLTTLISAGGLFSWLISIFIRAFFELGFFGMALDAADGKKPDLASFGSISVRKIVNLFVAGLIYNIVIVLGLILLILPGIFIGVRLQFYAFFIIEHDHNAISALSKSWECTNGKSLNLILLGLVLVLINLLGLMICCIGFLVTYSMTIIAFAMVYRLFTGSPIEQVDFESITDETIPTE